MAWVETQSTSFAARHASGEAAATAGLLGRLETFRGEMSARFPSTPWDVTVVVHSSPGQLALAHPWLPLARRFAAPAGRRYVAGWFGAREIHVLSSRALAARASAAPGSREALARAAEHEYAHVVVGLNNPGLPPPFGPRSVRGYLGWAWLCEGAATHLSGQSRLLGPAVARRLREGGTPAFPPSARDALLLGGTLFDLLEEARGPGACVALASRLDPDGPGHALERAFGRDRRAVESDWRDYLTTFAARGRGPSRRA